jgi:hypothetical protein
VNTGSKESNSQSLVDNLSVLKFYYIIVITNRFIDLKPVHHILMVINGKQEFVCTKWQSFYFFMHLNAYQKHKKQLFLKLFYQLIISPHLNKLVIELNEREYKSLLTLTL